MIDHANLRANPQQVKDSQRYRGESVELVDQVIALDEKRRAAINRADQLRAEHKKMSKTISGCLPEERAELVAKASSLADEVKKAQNEERDFTEQFDRLAPQISNIIDPDAPIGSEDDYVVLKTVGEPQVPEHIVNGDQVNDHLSIATKLGLLDMDRGAKVGGARFYFLTGYGALLENALIQLGLSYAVRHDFIPVIPPVLVKPEIMQGTGFLGQHSAEVYQVTEDNLYLVGTSEVALAGMHQGEILDLTSGPLRYAGISTCFRREAGSYGKDTRGIIRVHQFNKVEMFCYCSPEDAVSEHNRLLNIEEELLSALELPYRVIDTASGDLGSSAARKYDVEAWVPSQNTYRELTSTSNCTTFQARRLGVRYRDENNKTQYAATLNGTLATTRWLVPIIENYYQPDGSIRIPEVLVPFMGGITEIRR